LIGDAKNLIEMDLSSNKLKELPESFGMLTKLAEFKACYNKITHLPENFGK